MEAEITDLSHNGRGVARVADKVVFIHGALPGETVRFKYTARQRQFDEGRVVDIVRPSADRVEPHCPHAETCNGCALQHLQPARQIEFKQKTLVDNLNRIGKVQAERLLEPLVGTQWAYRRKARLSVRWVEKKQRVLVGFREKDGRFVADCSGCPVLHPDIGERLSELSELIGSLSVYRRVPQLEIACGDQCSAIVVRHMDPLTADDIACLTGYMQASGLQIYLQAKGPDSVTPLQPGFPPLRFTLPEQGLVFEFGPLNFIQVNADLNRRMIARVLDIMQAGPQQRILDLFCGLGNFTLPLARHAGEVVGVEGDSALIALARHNAQLNDIQNVRYYAADLSEESDRPTWLDTPYDQVLLDPPRAGAEFILPQVAATGAARIVYVSCHPASLARDAGLLVHQLGYRLTAAGVMDMFPHTGHVESIAVFEK